MATLLNHYFVCLLNIFLLLNSKISDQFLAILLGFVKDVVHTPKKSRSAKTHEGRVGGKEWIYLQQWVNLQPPQSSLSGWQSPKSCDFKGILLFLN